MSQVYSPNQRSSRYQETARKPIPRDERFTLASPGPEEGTARRAWSLGSNGEHVDATSRPANHTIGSLEPEAAAAAADDVEAGVNVELEAWGPRKDQVEDVAWGSPHAGQVELQERGEQREQQAWGDQVGNWGHGAGERSQQQERQEPVPTVVEASPGGSHRGAGLSALESAARNSARARSSWGEGGSSSARESREGTSSSRAGGYATSSMSSGAPCGACKFLRRKCVRGCIFAPYFGAEQGAARFAAVHKIFGASNVAKLLLHIPVPRRCDAVLTISYEAQARLSDPVYGCVATIFALQQQVPISFPFKIIHPHQLPPSLMDPNSQLVSSITLSNINFTTP